MSVVMNYTPEQVAEWARRGPEPVALDLPGWERHVRKGEADRLLPNELIVTLTQGAQRIHLIRCWDRPLTAGAPMATASTRTIEIAGNRTQVHTTSLWQGHEQVVDVVFLNGSGYAARVVFEGCPSDVVDEACQQIEVLSS